MNPRADTADTLSELKCERAKASSHLIGEVLQTMCYLVVDLGHAHRN